MKVGIITFHASHNYGSMLQAYALQQTVLALGHECEIINFRTAKQKKIFRPFLLKNGWRGLAKALIYPNLAINDLKKHHNFEKFIQNYMSLSPLCHNHEELERIATSYDFFISGSDQIWNTGCWDFETAYFLDFVSNRRKIAYAPSMGPYAFYDIPSSTHESIKEKICDYNYISAREPDTAKMIKNISGLDASVVIDPTFLLSTKHWSKIAGEKPLINSDYILLYTPWFEKHRNLYTEAARIAKKKNIKIICTLSDGYRECHKFPKFEYFTAVGPIEFLNLIKHARGVLCGSFHAVVFSIIFAKPFYAHEGLEDSRISHLLKLTGLENCAETPDDIIVHDFTKVQEQLGAFIESSRSFLKEALI